MLSDCRWNVILRLWRLFVVRTMKPLVRIVTAVVGLGLLQALFGMWSIEINLLIIGAALSAILVSVPMIMIQEKIDGSLAFLASLPITGYEHAAARILLIVTAAVPMMGYVAATAWWLKLADGWLAVGLGALCGVVMMVAVVGGVGCQYRYSVEQFMSMGMGAFGVIVLAGYVVGEISWLRELLVMLIVDPIGVTIGALLAGGIGLLSGWYAVRMIVRRAPMYSDETLGK